MSLDKKLLRTSEFPSIYCPGCGHGIAIQAAIRACSDMGWKKDDVYAVSGIGCSARTPAYMDFNSVQTTHGRALAFATGMKTFRPEKHVFLMLGDGDCMSIGGNHFLHACRRNIDLTVVVLNNFIYGMTGGQTSPTSPHGSYTTTATYGNIDEPIDVCKVAEAAGATFVARTTAYHATHISSLIKQGFMNKGFSVIEVLSPCPTGFGRRNGFRHVTEMYDFLKNNSITIQQAEEMDKAELTGKFVIGVFKNEPREEYIDKYQKMLLGIKDTDELADLCPEDKSYEAERILGKNRYECRLSGSGGQGLLLAGVILSESMIRQGKNAVHTQSYGVEARGGASRSDVVISDGEISFPGVYEPDMLLALSQDSYDRFASSVRKGGLILADSTFVETSHVPDVKNFECPITNIAKDEVGQIRTTNVVSLGLITGLNPFVSKEAMLDATLSRLPAKLHDINRKAFETGYRNGLELKEQGGEDRKWQ